MSQFVESICCIDGKRYLLAIHQKRIKRTFDQFFIDTPPLNLEKTIQNVPPLGKYKCRIVYNAQKFEIEFVKYELPHIKTLTVVHDNQIEYAFKSTNRHHLTRLLQQKGQADDIIIVKNGWVTDSYFANIACYKDEQWWTPSQSLLKGIKRTHLLQQGIIKEKPISLDDLSQYKKIALINAMNDLGNIEIDTHNILI